MLCNVLTIFCSPLYSVYKYWSQRCTIFIVIVISLILLNYLHIWGQVFTVGETQSQPPASQSYVDLMKFVIIHPTALGPLKIKG